MLKIEFNGKRLEVTRGAYNSMYKPFGWVIVGDKQKEEKEAVKATEEATEVDEWAEAEAEAEAEANLDTMTAKELKRLAKSKGINPEDYKTLGELRKALKAE